MRESHILKSVAALCMAFAVSVSSMKMVSASDYIFETEAEIPGTDAEISVTAAEDPGISTEESVTDNYPSDISEDVMEESCVSEPSSFDDELTGSDESENQGVVADPTVEDSEDASYYEDGDGDELEEMRRIVPRSPFSDVQNMYQSYYVSICWAGNYGVSKGFEDGTFRSEKTCTRGEAMMFIWKMMGKPSPKYVAKSPFRDVSQRHMYYQAVLWGWQKGVTKGYPDGTFGIDESCTRGQVMRFLWNLDGWPKVTGSAPFKDIKPSHPYYKAVVWGAQTGITKGYSDGTFGTNRLCTRGQIVTFLYRYFLNSFYKVKIVNGRTMSVTSPISKKEDRYYEKVLTADKGCITIPTIPDKTLFIGNSLLVGLGSDATGGRFGMCASDSEHDYAFQVQRAILAKNPEAQFAKLSGRAFEGCVDSAAAMQWYEMQKENFSEDLDLIIIQLGDNVNTAEKQAAFNNNVGEFLKRLKFDCPKARIIFVATWYKKSAIMRSIVNACKDNGCDFVYIADLYRTATLPTDGYVVTYNDGSSAIAVGGSLTHPNDLGMEKIAGRIIDILKL